MNNPAKIVDGDLRLETLMQAMLDLLYERAEGLPLPSVIGVLEIIKATLIRDAME